MKFYLIAGEASGDLHGSNLMRGLYARDPEADIRFWGGGLMDAVFKEHQQGNGLVRDYREGAVMGICFARQGKGHWVREFQPWDAERMQKYEATGFHMQENLPPLEEGETAYMMIGDFVDDEDGDMEADHVLNESNWITIVPNTIDRTDFEELKRLRDLQGTEL